MDHRAFDLSENNSPLLLPPLLFIASQNLDSFTLMASFFCFFFSLVSLPARETAALLFLIFFVWVDRKTGRLCGRVSDSFPSLFRCRNNRSITTVRSKLNRINRLNFYLWKLIKTTWGILTTMQLLKWISAANTVTSLHGYNPLVEPVNQHSYS